MTHARTRFLYLATCALAIGLGCGGGQFQTDQPDLDPTPCMFDSSSATYKECFHVDALGQCQHFGAPCTPPGNPPCMFDPDTGTYRECYHVTAGGGCAHYGTACQP